MTHSAYPATDWFADGEARKRAFFNAHNLHVDRIETMFDDMAPRRYYRLWNGTQSTILQESPPDDHPQALPGHYIKDYLKVQARFAKAGFSVPKVIIADESQGLVVLEDFGPKTYAELLQEGAETEPLYEQATLTLRALRNIPEDVYNDLPRFEGGRIDEGMVRFMHWFVPYATGRKVTDHELRQFHEMKAALFAGLPQVKRGLVHGDYHPGNLMPLLDRSGIQACGLLDFQGAFQGACVYDLVNLLADGRRDIPHELLRRMKGIYYEGLTGPEKDAEEEWYHALALHFHARIAGQFIKIALTHHKTHYLKHLPRVINYLRLSPVSEFKAFLSAIDLTLERPFPDVDLVAMRGLIRDDAI